MASYLPATHYYIPRVEQREPNLFTEEYYSSTDTKIYIDGIEQTEIGYISYSVQEQLKPLYGYSSHTFDDMAVGNRIVTGMFKVPIRNPEIQTPLEDILESLSSDDSSSNDDYNEKENELLDLEDWIKPQDEDDIVTDDNYIEDDEIYSYVTKLEALGYDVNESSTMQQIFAAVKKFQQDVGGLEINGRLDSETKTKINQKIKDGNVTSVKVKSGTSVYASPFDAEGIEPLKTLDVDTKAYVIDTIIDGWIHILFDDNTEGYIRTSNAVYE